MQGFREAGPPTCRCRYPALMFQPRLVGVLFLVGLGVQAWWYFAGLGAVLLWSGLLPRLSPFDALYHAAPARWGDRPELPPAPGPRRFAQVLAGSLMLAVAGALLAGRPALAWGVEALLALAIGALVFGRFCLGSYLYLVFRGEGEFARKTLPWS